MLVYLFVGLGGACGSLVRFSLGKIITKKTKRAFPLGTLIINISGALLLGFINNMNLSSNLLLFLADGFLAAYTTFSTFMYEGFTIFHNKKHLNATIYIVSTLLLGLVSYALGQLLAKAMF